MRGGLVLVWVCLPFAPARATFLDDGPASRAFDRLRLRFLKAMPCAWVQWHEPARNPRYMPAEYIVDLEACPATVHCASVSIEMGVITRTFLDTSEPPADA